MLVWAYRASYGLPAIITRGSNTYGPHQYPEKIIPLFITNAIDDRPLPIYGDGSAVRDYLHVTDLAEGHVAAVRALLRQGESFTVNLGTGGGTSVLGVVRAFEQASGRKIPFEFAPRRPGDVAQYFADVSLAASLLDWRATRNIEDMCRDSWRWQQSNPHGYQTAPALV